MGFLKRLFNRAPAPLPVPTEELIDRFEKAMSEAIRAINPTCHISRRICVRAEYAAFCLWAAEKAFSRDSVPQASTTCRKGLSLLRIQANRTAHFDLFSKTAGSYPRPVEPDAIYSDRSRLYSAILAGAPNKFSLINPPEICCALAKLSTISASDYRVSPLPDVDSVAQLTQLANSYILADREIFEAEMASSTDIFVQQFLPRIMESIWELDDREKANRKYRPS